jgi:hypothetical protein
MNNNIYQIEIKKEYAAAIIEDLKQMDAIEILEPPIPQWQQEESLKRLTTYHSNPTLGMDEEAFFKELEREG